MTALTNLVALVGRILLAFLFVQGGYNKLFGGIAGTVATMTSHGIPFPDILVWGAILVELGIGLCLIAGRGLRVVIYPTALWVIGILSPLVVLPGRLFGGPDHAPTLEGQYVIKDLILLAAVMAIAATVRRRPYH